MGTLLALRPLLSLLALWSFRPLFAIIYIADRHLAHAPQDPVGILRLVTVHSLSVDIRRLYRQALASPGRYTVFLPGNGHGVRQVIPGIHDRCCQRCAALPVFKNNTVVRDDRAGIRPVGIYHFLHLIQQILVDLALKLPEVAEGRFILCWVRKASDLLRNPGVQVQRRIICFIHDVHRVPDRCVKVPFHFVANLRLGEFLQLRQSLAIQHFYIICLIGPEPQDVAVFLFRQV